MTAAERKALGEACVGLDELTADDGAPPAPPELALVWHRAIDQLDPHPPEHPSPRSGS